MLENLAHILWVSEYIIFCLLAILIYLKKENSKFFDLCIFFFLPGLMVVDGIFSYILYKTIVRSICILILLIITGMIYYKRKK